jgi:hypothetical protein
MGRKFAPPGNFDPSLFHNDVSFSVRPSRVNMQYEQDSQFSQSSRHTVG